MKKLLLGTILLGLVMVGPIPTMAGVNVGVGIFMPPIVFEPHVVVMPDTDDVYVVPDIDVELFFWNGWWWRPWEGRWYRSSYYDRGWAYYNNVPSFYYDIDPGWRRYYRDHNWYGRQWNYNWIPNRELQRNWKSWNNNKYWERERTWDVQKYRPRPQQQRQELRRQRQEQYQQRPEVRRDQRRYEQERQQEPQQQHSQPGDRERHDQDRGQDYEHRDRDNQEYEHDR